MFARSSIPYFLSFLSSLSFGIEAFIESSSTFSLFRLALIILIFSYTLSFTIDIIRSYILLHLAIAIITVYVRVSMPTFLYFHYYNIFIIFMACRLVKALSLLHIALSSVGRFISICWLWRHSAQSQYIGFEILVKLFLIFSILASSLFSDFLILSYHTFRLSAAECFLTCFFSFVIEPFYDTLPLRRIVASLNKYLMSADTP